VRESEFSFLQVRFFKVGLYEVRFEEVTSLDVRILEVSAVKDGVNKFSFAEVGSDKKYSGI